VAGYKSVELVRRLREQGPQVRVVMTHGAQQFVTPLTFQAVSGQPVHSELLDPTAEAAMGHIELARWADLIVVAPASANFMARLAHGLADDLLSTLLLASRAPVAIAPAMNQGMWDNPANQHNLNTLLARHIKVWGPAEGEQACGEQGTGRMLEPSELLQRVLRHFAPSGPLQGKTVMVTAGPTLEDIDPVRFIGNRSSGKMGYAIAQAAHEAGARVVLVSGPVALPTPPGVERWDVRSAHDMHQAVMNNLDGVDLFIAAAAVADYRPVTTAPEKIKKDATTLQIELIRNPDILRAVALQPDGPFTVGFAAETHNVAQYAQGKLKDKHLDMVCANQVGGEEGGFESDRNSLQVFWHGGQRQLPMTGKAELARQLVALIGQRLGGS